jgi:membrane protease YdiL (CAAX protease family)
MKKLVQSMQANVEFFAVIVTAFGYPIIASLLQGSGIEPLHAITNRHLIALGCFEFVAGGFLLSVLWLRGWTLSKIGFVPSFKDTGIGLLLLVGTTLIWIAIVYATYFISPATVMAIVETYRHLKGAVVSAPIVVSVSLINAAFEEIFVTGYIITALKPSRGPVFAMNVSVAIRLLYHLYQGQAAVLAILPLGLAYAFLYVRTGRLWPLFVAHAIQDILAMLHWWQPQ